MSVYAPLPRATPRSPRHMVVNPCECYVLEAPPAVPSSWVLSPCERYIPVLCSGVKRCMLVCVVWVCKPIYPEQPPAVPGSWLLSHADVTNWGQTPAVPDSRVLSPCERYMQVSCSGMDGCMLVCVVWVCKPIYPEQPPAVPGSWLLSHADVTNWG
jgi:hypothetical protein